MPEGGAEFTAEVLVSSTMLEFLGWVAARPRTYAEAMEAWRTSCPRLSVWEDAIGQELVRVDMEDATSQGRAGVRLTASGIALLRSVRAGDPL
jgi:hypothetical protein